LGLEVEAEERTPAGQDPEGHRKLQTGARCEVSHITQDRLATAGEAKAGACMSKLADVAQRIGGSGLAAGICLTTAPPRVRAAVNEALALALELEQERLQAEALGLSVNDYRLMQAFPEAAEWILAKYDR
jgi:hypothetical protein